MIYLDYNATTPVDPAVLEAMLPFLRDHYGNPSSNHDYGIMARKAVQAAREQVAGLLAAKPEEIVFTSGGSESNNTVIKGAAHSFREKGRHIITLEIEHPSVLNPCRYLEKNGYEITRLPVAAYGAVDPDDVAKALKSTTILVTIMHANNETGTIQPIAAIGEICRERSVLFHTDAAQSVGKIPVRVDELKVDFLSMAGHKLYAPKGVGALYIRDGVRIEPLIHGAGHEEGRRAGTENVAFDVALGRACQVASRWITDGTIRALADKFYQGLKALFGNRIRLNGHPENRLPNTLYVSFLGFPPSSVQKALRETAVSTGSACHSGSTALSPVLKAMGVAENELSTAIRFSLGRYTTESELDAVLKDLAVLA